MGYDQNDPSLAVVWSRDQINTKIAAIGLSCYFNDYKAIIRCLEGTEHVPLQSASFETVGHHDARDIKSLNTA